MKPNSVLMVLQVPAMVNRARSTLFGSKPYDRDLRQGSINPCCALNLIVRCGDTARRCRRDQELAFRPINAGGADSALVATRYFSVRNAREHRLAALRWANPASQ